MHLRASGDDCPYARDFISYSQWDIVTADPRSNQVAHRYLYNIKWVNKPFGWGRIQDAIDAGIEESVEAFSPFFLDSVIKFKKGGPPYVDAISIDGGFTNYIDQRDMN